MSRASQNACLFYTLPRVACKTQGEVKVTLTLEKISLRSVFKTSFKMYLILEKIQRLDKKHDD